MARGGGGGGGRADCGSQSAAASLSFIVTATYSKCRSVASAISPVNFLISLDIPASFTGWLVTAFTGEAAKRPYNVKKMLVVACHSSDVETNITINDGGQFKEPERKVVMKRDNQLAIA